MIMALRTSIKMTESSYQHLCGSYGGVCLACGEEVEEGIEPDAENYECPLCDEPQVFGAEQLLVMGIIEFIEPGILAREVAKNAQKAQET